jgi:hypothetical protein
MKKLLKLLPFLGLLLCIRPAYATGFTHAQASGLANATAGSPYTLGALLGTNPATGDLVCAHIAVQGTGTLTFFRDSNSNTYTITPKSSNHVATTTYANEFLVYLYPAPSNATGTFTMATSNNSQVIVIIDDFTVTGGTAAFVNDFIGNGTAATSPSTTPTVTPSATGNLLYAGINGSGHTLTGVGGGWTENSGGVTAQNDSDAAYILSSGVSGVAVAFTWTGSRQYNAMGMAFSFTASGGRGGSGIGGKAGIGGKSGFGYWNRRSRK